MSIESQSDVLGLMRIGKIVAQTIQLMKEAVRPGITTQELDEIGAKYLRKHGARSAPIITYNYPAWNCISLNDVATHGIPGPHALREGDLVKIDVSAELDGYFADAAITVAVPPITEQAQKLIDCALEARDAAIEAAQAGRPINVIGRAAEMVARRAGFHVLRDLTGHGVGRKLHEPPSVPHVFMPRMSQKLTEGLVITIEPHIAVGTGRIVQDDDGWTLRTRDGSLSAEFEHTVVITKDRPVIVTAL